MIIVVFVIAYFSLFLNRTYTEYNMSPGINCIRVIFDILPKLRAIQSCMDEILLNNDGILSDAKYIASVENRAYTHTHIFPKRRTFLNFQKDMLPL